MKQLRNYFLSFATLFIFGCQTTASLKPVEDISNNKVIIIDNRSEDSKQTFRSSIVSPLIKLGDNKFDTPPMNYLKNDLFENMPDGLSQVTLEILEFSLADFFPVRLNSAMEGGLTGTLGSMGIPYYGSNNVDGVDSIICTLKGNLNNKAFATSSQVPYQISPFATLVRKTDEWLEALKQSIKLCAIGAYN